MGVKFFAWTDRRALVRLHRLAPHPVHETNWVGLLSFKKKSDAYIPATFDIGTPCSDLRRVCF